VIQKWHEEEPLRWQIPWNIPPYVCKWVYQQECPIGTEPALLTKFPLSPEGVEPDIVVETIVMALVADGVADGERTYDEPVTCASTWSNVGVDVRLTVPMLGANGAGANGVTRKLGAKNVNNKSLSLSAIAPSRIELDLDAYVNNPDSCQLTKKAICGNQVSLITAARSASTSASPVQFSLYSNKRNAISSPAKSGSALRNSNLPSCENLLPRVTQTTTDNTALETLEIQRNTDNAA
jgi:hypothetical protein